MGVADEQTVLMSMSAVVSNLSFLESPLKNEICCADNGMVLQTETNREARNYAQYLAESDVSKIRLIENWNLKTKKSIERKMAILVYQKQHSQEEIEDMLCAASFTVVVVGGIPPDFLLDDYFVLQVEKKEMTFLKSGALQTILKDFREFLTENPSRVVKWLHHAKEREEIKFVNIPAKYKEMLRWIIAIGELGRAYILHKYGKDIADQFFVDYMQKWIIHCKNVEHLTDHNDITPYLLTAMKEFFSKNQEFPIKSTQHITTEDIGCLKAGQAVLYDKKRLYLSKSIFDTICRPISQGMSSTVLKKKLADSEIIRWENGNYMPKQRFKTDTGEDIDLRIMQILLTPLLLEGDEWVKETFCQEMNQQNPLYSGQMQQSFEDNPDRKYIGRDEYGNPVRISDDAMNQHMLIVGQSGSGKSVRIEDMEHQLLAGGGMIIEIDIHGSHQTANDDQNHVILVQKDGLDEELLKLPDEKGRKSLAKSIADSIIASQAAGGQPLGANQKAELRSAVNKVNAEGALLDQIQAALQKQGSKDADKLYARLENFLEAKIFRCQGASLAEGKINRISFEGLDDDSRFLAIEIFLSSIMKKCLMQTTKKPITVIVDEFQHLSLQPKSSLHQILTEGRKYRLDLVLATQSLKVFERKSLDVIFETAVRLYFRPPDSDAEYIARKLSATRWKSWTNKLQTLRKGESITVGSFLIGTVKMDTPFYTYSYYSQ